MSFLVTNNKYKYSKSSSDRERALQNVFVMWFENTFLFKKNQLCRMLTHIVASDSDLVLAVTLLSCGRPTGKFVVQM